MTMAALHHNQKQLNAEPKEWRRLVLIDEGLPDLAILLTGIANGWQPVLVSRQQDALSVLQGVLGQHAQRGLNHQLPLEVAVVAHGAPGTVLIGSEPLTAERVQARAQDWCALGAVHLDLYSCFAGQDSNFIRTLEQVTGACVSASTHTVGHQYHSGTWSLQSSQAINRVVPFNRLAQQSWRHQLADFTGTLAEMLAKTNTELDSYDNLILTNTEVAAADLSNLNATTTTLINATSVQTVSGTGLDSGSNELGNLYADLTGITGLGNEDLTVTDEIFPYNFNNLLGYTNGSVTATLIDQGNAADFAFYADKVTTGNWGDAEKHAITYQFSGFGGYTGTGVADADNIDIIQKSTSVNLELSTVTALRGTAARVKSVYTSGGINGFGNEAVEITDTSVTAADLIEIDGYTTGLVDASLATTVTGDAATVLTTYNAAGITGLGDEYIVLSDSSITAADLNAVDSKTAGTVDANSINTITGNTSDVLTAYNSAEISGLGDEDVSLTDASVSVANTNLVDAKTTGTITAVITEGDLASLGQLTGTNNAYTTTITDATAAASDLNDLNSKTTVAIDASQVTTVNGDFADVQAAYTANAAGELSGLGNESVVLTDASVTVANANSIDAATTGVVTATISNGDLASLGQLTGTNNAYTITITDATVAATDLNDLNTKTTVTIDASQVTTVNGDFADVNTAYTASAAGELSGLGNESVVLTDTSVTVANANSIDEKTTGVVTATLSDNDLATLSTLSGSNNAYTVTITDLTAAAADLNAVDSATTEVINVDVVETVTGSYTDVNTAISSSGIGTFNLINAINGSPDVVALDVSGTATVAQIQTLDGKTSGEITATVSNGDMATLAGLTSLNNAHALTLTITDATVAADALIPLDNATTVTIDADAPTTLTGSYIDVVSVLSAPGISGLDDANITPTNLSLTSPELLTLSGLTTGTVDSSSIQIVNLPSETSSIGVDQSTFNFTADADLSASAEANGTAQAETTDGSAIASNRIVADAGVRDTDVTAGGDASITVNVAGDNTVSASTVNARAVDLSLSFVNASSLITAGAAHELSVYDAIVLGDADATSGESINGFTEGQTYYVSTIPSTTTFTLSATPGGEPIVATGSTSLTGFPQESSAYSAFTADIGGLIDATSSDVDLTSGANLTIDADVSTSASSSALNVDGDASAQTDLSESVGIENTGVSVAQDAAIAADVLATASAFAETNGASGAEAMATSDLDVGQVIGLNDLGDSRGDFEIGGNAVIDAAAGSPTDAVDLRSTALSVTGDANASATTTRLAGIYDAANEPPKTANVQLILDYSGSMKGLYADTDGDGNTDTSYQNLQTQVVTDLIDRVSTEVPDSSFQLIYFSSRAGVFSDWGTAEEAKQALQTFSTSGGTNYQTAVNTAISSWNNPGKKSDNPINLSFFFSDGYPSPSADSLQTVWESHLTSESINAYALGIGTAAPLQFLEPIDYDGSIPGERGASSYDSDGGAYQVSDPAQLGNILTTILDDAIAGQKVPSYLEVGGNSDVNGSVDAALNVSATTAYGDATASQTLTDAIGIDTQFIESGGNGSIDARTDFTSTVSALTVDGVATSTQAITEAKGADLQTIDVGASATGTSQAGIEAIADIDLTTTAQSTGDAITDAAVGDAQLDVVMGLDLSDADMTAAGNRGDSANSLLITGDSASVLAVADLTSSATSTSVDGNTEAVVKVGADDSTATGDAAIGFNLDDAAEIGSDANIDGQALASLAAVAATSAGVVGSGESRAAAGAEQVAAVDIDMVSTDVSSIGDSATIQALAQTDIAATADANEGNAIAEAGDLSAAAAGLNNSSSMAVTGFSANETITVGSTAQLDADAVAVVAATAQSLSGTADSTAKTTSVRGAETSILTINDDANLSGDARSSQSANSNSVSGAGSATATTLTSTGLDFNSTTTLAADAALQGTAVSNNAALAASNLDNATATASAGSNKGVDAGVSLAIGDDTTISGIANLSLDARASTQGDDASADAADANAGSNSSNIAMDLAAVIGGSAAVVADADLVATAAASGVVADVRSDVDLSKSTAVDVDQQTITTGEAFVADASSQVSSTAEAQTQTGDASAVIDVDQINGVDGGELGGTITSGKRLQVQTEAIASNVALASAVDADAATVTATIDNDLTRGLSLGTLTAGDSLALSSTAKSTQAATAQNVGDGSNDQAASANAANLDNIQGIANSTITSGGNADQLKASAVLTASAVASNQSAGSTTTVGSQTAVTALDSGVVTIGQDATNPIFAAETSLTSKASSTNGAARADSAYRDVADPASIQEPVLSSSFEPAAGAEKIPETRTYSVISIGGESYMVKTSFESDSQFQGAYGFRVYNIENPENIQETAYVNRFTPGFTDLGADDHISSVDTLTINGDPYLFLTQSSGNDSPETITVVNLSDPSNPTNEFRANAQTVPGLSSNLYSSQVLEINSSPYLLVSSPDGLQLLDASNPAQLSLTRTFTNATVPYYDSEVVSTNGGEYLIASSVYGMFFADVTDPSTGSTRLVADDDPIMQTPTTNYGNVDFWPRNFSTATVDGKTYAYLHHTTGFSVPDAPAVVILDITNPLAPTRAGEMLYEEYLDSANIELWYSWDSKTFVADGVPYLATVLSGAMDPDYSSAGSENVGEWVHVFDLSNPENPSYVTTLQDGGDIKDNQYVYSRSQLGKTTNESTSLLYEVIDGNRYLIVPTEGFNEGDPVAFKFIDLGPVVVSGETTTGIKNSTLTVDGSIVVADGSIGSILASADGTLLAEATSLQDDATTNVAQVGQGVKNSVISIADDGNLDASSSLEGRSIASVVGNSSADDVATANLVLDSTGVKQTSNQTISIGDSGLASGEAVISGEATSSAVTGGAASAGNLDVRGISLQNAEADITVNNSGDIRGLAVVGGLDAAGALSEDLSISATALDGDATASASFDAAGVSGKDSGDNSAGIGSAQTQLSAGSADGDLIGQMLAGGSVSATTTGDTANTDDASATISTSNLAGFENIDLRAGQSSGNLIKGTVFGQFDADAVSTYGDTTGSSDVNAFGIVDADSDGFMSVNGGVTAIAELSSSTTAITSYGNSAVTAAGDALGLSGFTVNSTEASVLDAAALSDTRGKALAVGGSAIA